MNLFDIEEVVSASESDAINDLALQAHKLMREIEQHNAIVKMLETQLQETVRIKLPEAMASAFKKEVVTTDGLRVKIDFEYLGSLPHKDKHPEEYEKAIKLIYSYGGADILKARIITEFDQGDNRRAFVASLLQKNDIPFDETESVHHMTLQKFARERMQRGEDVDAEGLGLFIQKVAKVKPVVT